MENDCSGPPFRSPTVQGTHPPLPAHCDSPRHTLSSGAQSSETSWDGPLATGPTNGLGTEQKTPPSWRSRILDEHLIDRPTPRPNTEHT